MHVVFPSVLGVLVLLSSSVYAANPLQGIIQNSGCLEALSQSFITGDCVFNFPDKEKFNTKEKFEAEVSHRVELACSDKCKAAIPTAIAQVRKGCQALYPVLAIIGAENGVAGSGGNPKGNSKDNNNKQGAADAASKLAQKDLLLNIHVWGPHLATTQREMACLKEPATPKAKTQEYCLVSRVKNADFKEAQWPKEIETDDIKFDLEKSRNIFDLVVNRSVAVIGPVRETVPCSNASATSLNTMYDNVLKDLPANNTATRGTFQALKASLEHAKAAAVAEEAKKKAAAAVTAGKVAAGHANANTAVQGAAALGAALVALLFMMA